MKRQFIITEEGYAKPLRAQKLQYENGAISPIGQTYELQKQICDDLVAKIHEKAPVEFEGDADQLLYRDLTKALAIYMGCHMNALSVTGYSDFHYSLIDTDLIQYAQPLPAFDPIRDEWGLEVGDKYYEWPKQLPCCITGDGFSGSHVSYDQKYMAMTFLKANAFKPDMQHCRQAGIMVLFSTLGDHDQRVVDKMQELVTAMGKRGKIIVNIERPENEELNGVKCLCRFIRNNNGDWAWQHKMSHCAIGPSGTFGIYQLVEFIAGVPYNVAKSEFNNLFPMNVVMPYDLPSLNELQNSHWNGFTLLTPEIAEAMTQRVEQNIEDKGIDVDTLTAEEEKSIRCKVARDEEWTGLMWPADYSTHGPNFDVCHAFWAWIGTMYTLLIMLMYVVWQWSVADIEWVLSYCALNTVVSQFCYYIKHVNPNRSFKPWFKLNTTGDGNKILMSSFPHVLSAAAWVCDEYEANRHDGLRIQTLILVVFWVVGKGMRYVFYVLFCFDFTSDTREADGTPSKIAKMIRICNKVTYIAVHICNIMVCSLIYIFIHVFMHQLHMYLHASASYMSSCIIFISSHRCFVIGGKLHWWVFIVKNGMFMIVKIIMVWHRIVNN